ncbi:MAG: helix-turn-helix domain-containing protein [Candidatus Izemoplasmatales bacterium]
MNIGEKIALQRKTLKLTQQQLADQLFVTVQAVSKWETGAGNPDIHILPQIAKELDVSIPWLLGEDEPTIPEPTSTNNIEIRKLRILELLIYLFTLFAFVLFLFVGFKYGDVLAISKGKSVLIYGSFLLYGVLITVLSRVSLALVLPKSWQDNQPLSSAYHRTKWVSYLPTSVMIGLYLFFLTLYDDVFFPLYNLESYLFPFERDAAILFYLSPSAFFIFKAYPNEINKMFVLPTIIISAIILTRFYHLYVISIVIAFVCEIAYLLWSISLISNAYHKIAIHVHNKRFLILPFDVLIILSITVLIALFLQDYGLNVFSSPSDAIAGIYSISIGSIQHLFLPINPFTGAYIISIEGYQFLFLYLFYFIIIHLETLYLKILRKENRKIVQSEFKNSFLYKYRFLFAWIFLIVISILLSIYVTNIPPYRAEGILLFSIAGIDILIRQIRASIQSTKNPVTT